MTRANHEDRRAPAIRCRGVTLIELLTAIAITTVLLTVAVPAFQTAMSGVRLGSASNAFLASLYLARSEAIKRNARTVLCKSSNGTACVSSGDWEQGWIVFHDADNDAALDSGESLILRVEAMADGYAMRGNAPVASYVSYSPTGASMLVSGAFQAGTVTVCQVSASGGESREIIISATGRPRARKSTVSTCPS